MHAPDEPRNKEKKPEHEADPTTWTALLTTPSSMLLLLSAVFAGLLAALAFVQSSSDYLPSSELILIDQAHP